MKVKELIKELQKQDPEKEVMIQQGEEHDYMLAYTVKELSLINYTDLWNVKRKKVIVIEYS